MERQARSLTTANAGAERGVWLDAIGAAGVIAVVLAQWVTSAQVPLFGEDCAHLAGVAAWDGPWAAFAPDRLPARPLQWLAVWCLAPLAESSPLLARLPAALLQLACFACMLATLRAWRVPAAMRAAAIFCASLSPSVVNLLWLVAIGYPLRAFLAVAAAACWWHHLRTRAVTPGLVAVACGLSSALTHESGALLTAGLAVAWLLRPGGRGIAQALRDPCTWALVAIVAWRAVDLLWLQAVHQYRVQVPGAIAANAARALLNPFPAAMREAMLAGLRGGHGGLAFVGSLVFVGGIAAGLLVWFWRGDARTRFLLLLAAFEQVAAVLTVGVGVRYLHVSVPLLLMAAAVGAAQWSARARVGWLVVVGGLATTWSIDMVATTRAFAAAGVVARQIVEDVRREQAAMPASITVVDLPMTWGSDRQIPFLAWGAREFLQRNGISGPVRVVLTRAVNGSTDMELAAESIEALRRRDPGGVVLAFDAEVARLVRAR